MAKYILVNRDPFNLVRQKCDTNLPGAGDPPVSPGSGKEFVQGKYKRNWCLQGMIDASKFYANCWGPCGSFAGENLSPSSDQGLNPENQNEAWEKGWKKHNAVWGSLPRNKKRPNILDQNAKFVCLQLLMDQWGVECPHQSCCCPPNPGDCDALGKDKYCPRANCNKPSHKFSMTDKSAMRGSNECGFCKKCWGYGVSMGIAKEYRVKSPLINYVV